MDPRTPSEAFELLRAAIAPQCDARAGEGDRGAEIAASIGRVLAEPLRMDRPSPPADASAMDGYALRLASLARSPGPGSSVVVLPVAGEVSMGAAPPPLPDGACVRITTGGAVPAGADAILRREEVRELGGGAGTSAGPGTRAGPGTSGGSDGGGSRGAPGGRDPVDRIEVSAEVVARARPGQHIRRAGENAAAGAVFARPGRLIDAALVGAMAAAGLVRVAVRPRLRVAIVTTGDELAPAGGSIDPWRLRDSNGPALEAMLRARAWIGSIDRAHATDDIDSIVEAIGVGAEADALVLTGGVSMGHRDLVPEALRRRGIRTLFHRVRQRPGQPILGAISSDGRPTLALPGNPVSVLVTARRFLVPALALRAGLDPGEADDAPRIEVSNPDESRLDLWWHRLVRRDADGRVSLIDQRGSGDLVAAAGSDGFVEIPPGQGGRGPWPFRSWMR